MQHTERSQLWKNKQTKYKSEWKHIVEGLKGHTYNQQYRLPSQGAVDLGLRKLIIALCPVLFEFYRDTKVNVCITCLIQ